MITLSEYRSDDKNMILADVQMLANNYMFEHGLMDQGWFFNFDRAKTRFGCCDYRNKVISMSKYLTPSRTFAQNRNTILHEIAHALTPGHHHDAVWEMKALEIGADGNRCGKMDADAERPAYRWVATHECGLYVGMHRAPGRVRSCNNCAPGGFSYDHLVDWYQWGEKATLADMPEKFRNEYLAIQRKYAPGVAILTAPVYDEDDSFTAHCEGY